MAVDAVANSTKLNAVRFGSKNSPSKLVEQRRRDDLVEYRRCQHSPEHDKRQRVQDFLAGLPGTKQQRKQADEACRGGHHDRGESFQTASDDHFFSKHFAFMFHEMNVV